MRSGDFDNVGNISAGVFFGSRRVMREGDKTDLLIFWGEHTYTVFIHKFVLLTKKARDCGVYRSRELFFMS